MYVKAAMGTQVMILMISSNPANNLVTWCHTDGDVWVAIMLPLRFMLFAPVEMCINLKDLQLKNLNRRVHDARHVI